MNQYKQTICTEMNRIASLPNSIFLGQHVIFGSNQYGTLSGVPKEKKIEMPIAEEMQMGISIGMSLMGYVVVSVYQRMDFLMRAMDQIVNHLDKIVDMSHGQFSPKVIIRTSIGCKFPIDAGPQHTQNLISKFSDLKNINIKYVDSPESIIAAYRMATDENDKKSIMIVEDQNLMYAGEK